MAKKTNAEYWAKRKADAQKWIAGNLKNDEAMQRRLLAEYQQAAKAMQAEIDREYRAYAAHENLDISDAMKAVSDEDVQDFAAEAAQLVQSKDFSPEANARLKLYNATMRINRLEYLKAQMGMQLLKATAGAESKLNGDTAKAYADECNRQSGLLSEYAADLDYPAVIKNIAKQYNPEGFSKNIWKNQDIIKAKLDQQLTQAMVRGMNPRVIARELRPAVSDGCKSAAYAAERIARTEMARAQNQAQLDSFEANGIDKVIWVSEPGACDICKPRDDQSYKREEVPDLPAHPNCRCALSADPDWDNVDKALDEYLGKNEEAKDAGMSDEEFNEWMRKVRTNSLDFSDVHESQIRRVGEHYYAKVFTPERQARIDANQAILEKARKVITDYNRGATRGKDAYENALKWENKRNKSAKDTQKYLINQAKASIAEVRPLGLSKSEKQAYQPRSNRSVVARVNTVLESFPQSWSNNSAWWGSIKATKESRGYYNDSLQKVVTSGRTTISQQETVFHEMGHRMEAIKRPIMRLEHEFYARRVGDEELQPLSELTGNKNYRADETARPDNFLSVYMGKDYGNTDKSYYELLSMGSEALYTGSFDLSKDKDYATFILGLFLSV